MRKRFGLSLALAAVLGLVLVGMSAAAGGQLRCFAAFPGTCTLAPAVNGAALDTTSGGVAGVYFTNGKSFGGRSLADVDFSFEYRCAPTNVDTVSCVAGGAPRWSIPIDDGLGTQNLYAFIDAANCGYTGTVSTELATCPVFLNTGPSYANWDAFAAANPTWTIAHAYPFVISDVQTGNIINLYDVTETK